MHSLLKAAIVLPWLTLSCWAGPTDEQVLDLHQLWSSTLAASGDFSEVAPLMSRASLEQIHRMDANKRQALFAMMKMSQPIYADARWNVEGHQKHRGTLVYKLTYHGTNSGSLEFPVTEEDGQLLVDWRDR
ncbi:hypothetical protein IV102_03490 [bacterium]|nr:hypothetical protein [bacterium]